MKKIGHFSKAAKILQENKIKYSDDELNGFVRHLAVNKISDPTFEDYKTWKSREL